MVRSVVYDVDVELVDDTLVMVRSAEVVDDAEEMEGSRSPEMTLLLATIQQD